MKKLLALVPTGGRVEPEVFESLCSQDYPDYDWIVQRLNPQVFPKGDQRNTSTNSTRNRNALRKIALATDAERFLFLDSDTVLPPKALSKFMLQDKDIIGGWYQCGGDSRFWAAGKWVADNTTCHLQPQPSLIRVDWIGLGCLMVSRKALADLEFKDGMDRWCLDVYKRRFLLGESVAFCNDAYDKGYSVWADGSVICKHIKRA